MHDQDGVSSYVNSNVFEVGEVVAFRGTEESVESPITYLCAVLAPDPESAGTFLLKLHEMMTIFAIPYVSTTSRRMRPWYRVCALSRNKK